VFVAPSRWACGHPSNVFFFFFFLVDSFASYSALNPHSLHEEDNGRPLARLFPGFHASGCKRAWGTDKIWVCAAGALCGAVLGVVAGGVTPPATGVRGITPENF
jgi:hypothetical protein